MSKDLSQPPECVIYTCCGSKCKKKGGKHLFKMLKHRAKESHLKRKLQIIRTGCTDRCKLGPVMSVMPQNQWFFQMTEEKAVEIFDREVQKLSH